ncbi:MAG TPA: hypothetical protein VFX16_36175 [Pseudonocardiaceae bacterium]|nr:hypothetical protein [Pseudonocardiaceae bacterium]
MKRVNHLVMAITGVAVVLLAACGSKTGPQPVTLRAVSLSTVQLPTLGTIVVDSRGRTVYRYDKDTSTPPASNCTGSCAKLWPPVPAPNGALRLAGGLEAAVGTVTRADGTKQLTLDGWPLYEYAGDNSQGVTTGQGFGKIWWAVTPAGSRATSQATPPATPPAAATSGSSSGGSGSLPGY